MERRNVILLTILAVATLLTAMVGSTFAWFTIQLTNKKPDQQTSVGTATLNVSYQDGSKISTTGIIPGWSAEKEITVTNNSEVDVYYTVSFAGAEAEGFQYSNEFTNLEYKLTSDAGNAETTYNAEIVGTQDEYTKMGESYLHDTTLELVSGHLIKGESHKFTLGMQLKDIQDDQTEADSGKTFKGKLVAVATTVKPN